MKSGDHTIEEFFQKKKRVYFLVLTGDFCVAKQFDVRFEPKKVECHLIPFKKKTEADFIHRKRQTHNF
tara:strand:+ start:833 stop:1036 length:204 start_codon:yes stop_codon:yes gene_type:complete